MTWGRGEHATDEGREPGWGGERFGWTLNLRWQSNRRGNSAKLRRFLSGGDEDFWRVSDKLTRRR